MTAYLLSSFLHVFLFQTRNMGYEDSDSNAALYATLLFFGIIVWAIYAAVAPRKNATVTEHWFHQFNDLQLSSQEFYKSLVASIKEAQIPNLVITTIEYSEAGILSSKREYLRIHRNEVVYDICACPFGRGYFISWWRGQPESPGRAFVAAIPFIGKFLERLFFPQTYYQIDTEKMFNGFIHSHVLAAVDAIVEQKGLRGLTEEQRRPIDPRR